VQWTVQTVYLSIIGNGVYAVYNRYEPKLNSPDNIYCRHPSTKINQHPFSSFGYGNYERGDRHYCPLCLYMLHFVQLTHKNEIHTTAVCKVCGLTLLLRVGTLWRWGDGLFFEVPSLAGDALLTTLHPLLENMLHTVEHFEISCLGARFSWLEKYRNRTERDLNWILCSAWKKWIGGTPLEHSLYSPDLVLVYGQVRSALCFERPA
jgi:hypothetical protein